MLPKKNRLNREEFDSFLLNKKIESNEICNIAFNFSQNKIKKFSCVVSKKVSKKAVERNLLKRRVYFFLGININKIKEGVSVIVYLKKVSLEISYQELDKLLIYLLKKVKIM